MELIDNLISDGWLKTPNIIEAFRKIKRVDFLPAEIKDLAEMNEAMPIGSGQTISQPLTVAFMLELLQPQKGETVLDVGAGSGWSTALLAEIVGDKGKVIAIELVKELAVFGKNNIAKYSFIEKGIVECYCQDASKGFPELKSGFDRILASASIREKSTQGIESVPVAWKQQIKIGGRVVTPINDSIWLFEKIGQDKFREEEHRGFTFVPLIQE